MADVRMMSGSATSASKYLLHQLDSRGWSLDDLFSKLTCHNDYVIAVVTNRWHRDLSLTDLVEVAEDLARALEVAPEPLMAMFLADRGREMSESATRHGFHIVYEPDGQRGTCRCGWETKVLADFMAVARAWATHVRGGTAVMRTRR